MIQAALETFAAQKRLAERAIEQLTDDQLREPLDENTNSIAVIVKHMSGNMVSRWTDFLDSDGEKPWRNRDDEFRDTFADRAEMLAAWERGWTVLLDAVGRLTEDDLQKEIRIRGEELSVPRAILRQIDHYGYHVGQIVLIARILAKDNWTVLTIPRGQSQQYNEQVWKEK